MSQDYERAVEMMTAAEFNKFEARWKRVFAVAAGVFVVCLLGLVAFPAHDSAGMLCYSLGGSAAIVGLYAARKLRDPERVEAIVDGEWLNANAHPGIPEVDLDTDD